MCKCICICIAKCKALGGPHLISGSCHSSSCQSSQGQTGILALVKTNIDIGKVQFWMSRPDVLLFRNRNDWQEGKANVQHYIQVEVEI